MVCLERDEKSWGRWDLIWILHHDKNLKDDRYRTIPAQINKIYSRKLHSKFSAHPYYSTEMLKGDWNCRIKLSKSPGSMSHCQLFPLCINYFLCLFDSISDINNLKNEWYGLAHRYRQFNPELFDPMYLRNLLLITRTPHNFQNLPKK